jgi:DNA-directed RNA polymerase subunit RPC12/RpoP
MNKRNKPSIPDQRCENCGAPGVQLRFVADVYDGILIENIPQYACARCGERYITSTTQEAINRIREQPERYAKEKKVLAAALA